MLKIDRKPGEGFTIFIDRAVIDRLGDQTVEVVPIRCATGRVTLGIRGPRDILVLRNELIHPYQEQSHEPTYNQPTPTAHRHMDPSGERSCAGDGIPTDELEGDGGGAEGEVWRA